MLLLLVLQRNLHSLERCLRGRMLLLHADQTLLLLITAAAEHLYLRQELRNA